MICAEQGRQPHQMYTHGEEQNRYQEHEKKHQIAEFKDAQPQYICDAYYVSSANRED